MRIEHEGGTDAWLAGTLAAPSVQGHGLPQVQELWPYQSLFSSLLSLTEDCDCSHEIKRRLLPGRKVMTNLESILKTRDITLPAKVHLVKAMVFPVVIYG